MGSRLFRPTILAITAILLVAASLPVKHAWGADSNYEFSYQAPDNLPGAPGATVSFIATVMLSKAKDPVQGWAISGAVTTPKTCAATATSILDTAAEGADFNKAEVTTGIGNEGFVSATVLSFITPVTLSPLGVPHKLVKVLIEAKVPANGSLASCELRFIDGRRGSGTPVSNTVTVAGSSKFPVGLSKVVTIGNDCNSNGQGDALDLAFGQSSDCDSNSVPDECQADQDGDGLTDACDQCAADSLKTGAGVCGCGAPDRDDNGNGIVDCLVTQELAALIDQALTLTKQLRPKPPAKKLSALQQQLRIDLRIVLAKLSPFIKTNAAGIIKVSRKVKLAPLSKLAVAQGRWAIRLANIESRRLALRALRRLQRQLVL